MATVNIVPRTASEGSLGTESKPWSTHVADTAKFTYIDATTGNDLTLRRGGTAYLTLKAGTGTHVAHVSSSGTGSFGRLVASEISTPSLTLTTTEFSIGGTTNFAMGTGIATFGGAASIAGNLIVSGTLTAQEIHTEFTSASIVYESGSTKFGDTSDDIHSMTGSLLVKNGRIGIGVTTGSVGGHLHVYSSDNADAVARIEHSLSTYGAVLQLRGDSSNYLLKHKSGDGRFEIQEGTTNVFTIKDGGNVGIGTVTPAGKLDVQGGITASLGVKASNFYSTTDSAYLSIHSGSPWQSGSSNDVVYNEFSSIGVGTPTPSASMHVSGTFLIEGIFAGSNYDSVPAKIAGLQAWYVGQSYDTGSLVWHDISGNGYSTTHTRGAPQASQITASHGASFGMYVVSGANADGLKFPTGSVLPPVYTLIHLARYAGGDNERIFDGVDVDWYSGFQGNRAGKALHTTNLTSDYYQSNYNEWVLSVDQKNMYRADGTDRTIAGVTTGRTAHLSLNWGSSTQYSKYQVAEIIVYNRELNTKEIDEIEAYIDNKYGLNRLAAAATLGESDESAPEIHSIQTSGSLIVTNASKIILAGNTPNAWENQSLWKHHYRAGDPIIIQDDTNGDYGTYIVEEVTNHFTMSLTTPYSGSTNAGTGTVSASKAPRAFSAKDAAGIERFLIDSQGDAVIDGSLQTSKVFMPQDFTSEQGKDEYTYVTQHEYEEKQTSAEGGFDIQPHDMTGLHESLDPSPRIGTNGEVFITKLLPDGTTFHSSTVGTWYISSYDGHTASSSMLDYHSPMGNIGTTTNDTQHHITPLQISQSILLVGSYHGL
ncbi:MAG TPA: hypothetical protein EYF95_01900, partial [Flavobacteriales bacterium]|nr:hypothetical protein [Flavobacteriales bacterium]